MIMMVVVTMMTAKSNVQFLKGKWSRGKHLDNKQTWLNWDWSSTVHFLSSDFVDANTHWQTTFVYCTGNWGALHLAKTQTHCHSFKPCFTESSVHYPLSPSFVNYSTQIFVVSSLNCAEQLKNGSSSNNRQKQQLTKKTFVRWFWSN